MGKLEVVFRIRLAYPVLGLGIAELPAVATFAEPGNTVRIEAPQYGPAAGKSALEGFEEMTLRVERECTDEQGMNTSTSNRERLRINQDAGRAFWQLFEAIRESALRRDNTVFMYPVVPAEDIGSNPLVRSCELEWIYNGNSLQRERIGRGIPAIQVTDDWWADAVKRLGEGRPVPVYTRFALDAFYFAEHDPPRGIIMACAAWETALRCYLANVASKRDPAYLVASEAGNVPTLYESAKAARGGPLFYDIIDQAIGFERASFELYRKMMDDLRRQRNKLLHQGKMDFPEGAATDYALAVLAAIEWLFAGTES
jgi:hypothetical protein